jgi:hypothetical protein
MVNLLSYEAETDGVPLTETEKKLLGEEFVPGKTIPNEFRERVKRLISKVLERQQNTATNGGQRSFGDALEWVEPGYPNIAALAEEVITSGGFGALPPRHGKAWMKDRAQLIGCAIVLVMVLMTIGIAISFLFDHK